VERGWSGANEHYTQQNSNIDYRIENLVKAENPKYVYCLFVIPSNLPPTSGLFICSGDAFSFRSAISDLRKELFSKLDYLEKYTLFTFGLLL
jgi:hypothetical protein